MTSKSEAPPPYNMDNVDTEANTMAQNDSNYIISRASPYNTSPIEMDCPHCQNHIISHVEKMAGLLPWIVFAIIAFLGIFLFIIPWCFCCIPFFIDHLLDFVHVCPACKKFLGRYSRL